MLCEMYVEALLANEALADQVWHLWDDGEIEDAVELLAWLLVATRTDCATPGLY